MRTDINKTNRNAAFTIVELLTVLSIITILIGLLVPALNRVRRYSYEVKQKAQLKAIETALDFFNAEFGDYPDSGARDPLRVPYCGAMKLCEAMMGRDLMGVHQDSVLRSDGMDGTGKVLYLNTKNHKVTTASRPYRADTFILISAGYDGEYGTPDDICNYEWKYRESSSQI
ncbi:MAG: hypothetical protein ISS70_18265 [Phycisphaerae bacterium]|nr:hypothetical protein [Phycisphaerae bacterium]